MYKCFIFGFLFFSIHGWTQDPYHKIFNVEKGLPSNEIYDIHIDHHNIVWGTSDRGVFTYDGFDVKIYTSEDGLAFNTNFQIIDDQKGRIWFSGYDGSLSYFQEGKFHQSPNNDALISDINNSYYRNIGIDSLGQIYTHQIRLLWIRENPNFLRLEEDGSIFTPPQDFDTLAYCPSENFHVLEKKFLNTSFFKIPELEIYADNIITDKKGIHYLAFKSLYTLAVDRNPNSIFAKPSIIFKIENGVAQPMYESDSSIDYLFKDQKGNLLAATINGILLFDKEDYSKPPKSFFEDYNVTNINQDKEGNYWLSTHKQGLIQVPSFDTKTGDIGAVPPSILAIQPYKDKLFYTSAYYGLSYLDANLKSRPIKNGIEKENFYNLTILKDTLLTYARSLNLTKEPFVLEKKLKPHQNGRFTAQFNDSLYVGTGLNGYIISTTSKNIFTTLYNPTSAIKNVISMSHCQDKVWLGTLKGLYYFNTDKWKVYTKSEQPLLDVRINDLDSDKQGRLWVATIGNGILRHFGDELLQITTKDGLISNLVNCLFIESDSIIWAGTNKGLSKISLQESNGQTTIANIQNINNLDGLPAIYINDITKWNDDIWVATNNGLHALSTPFNLPEKISPSTFITNFTIDNFSSNLENGVVLDHNQNNGTIHFNGVSYRKPSNNFFRYKLELDGHISEYSVTDDRSFRLTNLTPGDYQFFVEARNKYNTWSEPSILSFAIHPHFSETWWFRLFSILTLAYLLYFIYKKRIEYLENNNRQRLKLNEAQLRTQIAELSTFRNQFNPHFIFNSLNSIQHYIFERDVKEANYFLSKFSKLIRESLQLSEQKLITLQQEFDFIEAYLKIEFLRFPNKCSYEIKNKKDLPLDKLSIPPLLLQPIIENVVKHAFGGTEEGILIILLDLINEDQISITIIDNGKGIKTRDDDLQKDKRGSFGIKIVRDRIALLNLDYQDQKSTFEISESPLTKGTIVKFVLPKITNV